MGIRIFFAFWLLAVGAVAVSAAPVHPAVYDVTFEATWSASTHPTTFPPNPHFSWLIGGTHDDQVVFWAEGELASLGIKRMAEWGSTTPLDLEVLSAVSAGHAGEVIESTTYPVSPGSVSTTFTVTPETPLATIVSMIAPSPDWFTGVAGLDLRDGDGWLASLIVDVFPYDAGTDSGTGYTSSDQPTSPPIPIAAIDGTPFTPGVPVGTLTFTLQTSATDVPEQPTTALTVSPNPFNPLATIRFESPEPRTVVMTVHDLRGRAIRRLWEGVAVGAVLTTWDGRDDDGRAMPSAVYLIRTVGVDVNETVRASLVR